MIPMARAGRVEEIAATVTFLLSPGGGYITGQDILVEGRLAKSN
jgi:NAD(P)-dependent dehydrogenase (short-subunit alcohol dehydrogenase family)